jgi:uncharacterized protein
VTAVCNASPIIGLVQIAQSRLLQSLFTTILVAPAVAFEVEPTLPVRPEWIQVKSLALPLHSATESRSLGRGEKETISLGMEIQADRIILDDYQARELAKRLGLHVVGTVGILLAAKRRQLIPSVKPHLDSLLEVGFFLSNKWYRHALIEADEL